MSRAAARSRRGLCDIFGALGQEGLRLFFPLAALHAAVWPLLWSVAYGLDLPFAGAVSPGLWHAGEMIFGSYGAAVLGFITTAIPEWSNTESPRGRRLFALAGLWAVGRIVGLTGAEGMLLAATLADMLWSAILVAYVLRVSWRKRTTGLLGIAAWLAALAATAAFVRFAILAGDDAAGRQAVHVAGLVMLGLLGLVLSRVTVPVTNLVLDPSEESSPFRPHPGRRNLAPALVAVAIAAELSDLSPAVQGYLLIAAGAAFLDRVAEGFIGREALRTEILALAGSSLFAGAGLLLAGAARLGAPFPETPAWHLAFMGGLGLGVLAVLTIAGLRHTGRPLGTAAAVRVAFLAAVAATLLRALPELGLMPYPPGSPYALSAALWAVAFLVWLKVYWPYLSAPAVSGSGSCGDAATGATAQ